MDEVNDYAKDKVQHFNELVEFRTVTFAKNLRNKKVLEKFIAFEKAVKVVTMAHAMEHMVYFLELMRIKKLDDVCTEMKKNYDPTIPTTYEDKATFT